MEKVKTFLKKLSADREKLRQIGIAAAFILVLIFALISLPKKPKPKTEKNLPAAALPAAPQAAPAQSPAKTLSETEVIPSPPDSKLIDPFALKISVSKREEAPPAPAAPSGEGPKPAELKLEGVWVDARMRVAFISGQALPVGEAINGWRVTSISKDRVILRRGSETKILKMEEK